MFIAERHEPLLPFPRLALTATAAGQEEETTLALRPFGLYESDLNVDFQRLPRPFLVTRILECCTTRGASGEKVGPEFFWKLTVGKRIECLLGLVASGESREIPLTLRCSESECGQELELEISLAEIAALQDEAYQAGQVLIRLGHEALSLRRPTGGDQLAWLKSRFPHQEAAVRAMLRTLLPEPSGPPASDDALLPDELVQLLDQAMQEHDPLVNFALLTACPTCAKENLYEIDLEELALSRLRRAQLRLLASVHTLAAHYHWSEQQIFSVPFWRRAHYLSLIEKEKH